MRTMVSSFRRDKPVESKRSAEFAIRLSLSLFLFALIILLVVLTWGCTASEAVYVQNDNTTDLHISQPVVVTAGEYDEDSGALITIDIAHAEIHEGESYSIADTVAANNTTVKWQLTTPNSTKYAHMVFTLACTGEAMFKVTAGSDRADGTDLEEVNRNRNSSNTSGVIVTRTPTGGTTDGIHVLFQMRNGITGTAGKSVETAQSRATSEWILKTNTKYVIAITTYADVFVTCILDWYELED